MREGLPALDYATVDRYAREGVIAPNEAFEAPAKPARGPTFMERLATRVEQDRARQRVADGHVHPLLYDYLRDVNKIFHPAEAAIYADPRSPNTVASTVRSWTRGVQESYRLWHDEAARGHDDSDKWNGSADVLGQYNRMIEGNERAASPIGCMVCLVIKPDTAPQIVLGDSSGNLEVDRMAVEALERAAARRPVDRDVKPEKACYRFTANVSRIPPLPIAGCGFDEVKMTFGCYYPTMRVYKTSVTLESVDDGS